MEKEKISGQYSAFFTNGIVRKWKKYRKKLDKFFLVPRGKNWLAKVVPEVMKRLNIEGNYRNHSLRGTLASALKQARYGKEEICVRCC